MHLVVVLICSIQHLPVPPKCFGFGQPALTAAATTVVAPAVLVSLPRLQLNEQPLQHLIILVRQERRPQRLQHHWPTVSLLHHLQEDSVSDNRPSLLPLTRVDRILVGSTNISTTPESTPFTNIDDPLVPGSDNNTFCFTFVWCCYGYQCCTT